MWYQTNIAYLLLIVLLFRNVPSEKVTFINLERPRVTYYNQTCLGYFNLTTTRYGRANPIYYVGVHFNALLYLNKTTILDFYFYELLTNVYKASFIHFHYNWCDLLDKEKFFGLALRQGEMTKPCPHPPGIYHLTNITINPKFIPKGFPFTNGRIYINISQSKTKVRIVESYIDMKLMTIDKKLVKD